jgi:hypothetical protein
MASGFQFRLDIWKGRKYCWVRIHWTQSLISYIFCKNCLWITSMHAKAYYGLNNFFSSEYSTVQFGIPKGDSCSTDNDINGDSAWRLYSLYNLTILHQLHTFLMCHATAGRLGMMMNVERERTPWRSECSLKIYVYRMSKITSLKNMSISYFFYTNAH